MLPLVASFPRQTQGLHAKSPRLKDTLFLLDKKKKRGAKEGRGELFFSVKKKERGEAEHQRESKKGKGFFEFVDGLCDAIGS